MTLGTKRLQNGDTSPSITASHIDSEDELSDNPTVVEPSGTKRRPLNYSNDRLKRAMIAALENESGPDSDTSMADLILGKSDIWEDTMQKVIKCVVSIHFASVSPFDTEGTYSSEATGFVVDAEKGIIMTNRHVVGPGLFYGYAVFHDHEETPVKPIYRDPVHDFGFLQFEPSKLNGNVTALNLRPELAQVGREIRIVGNDAGEKLSILSGYISRLDRNAPEYGDMTYNDFNTEYIQAAASASGGSSGSPVVDIDGNVVALQAGGSTHASTDFFLPLYRGQRALNALRDGLPVTRGTIQVQWLLKPYDECRRLGISAEEEKKARELFPESIGLLVAETILPEGPAAGQLEEGDVLISINGTRIAKFRQVDEILDEAVGQAVTVVIQRNSESVEIVLNAMDLHSITPDRFVSVSGAIFHNLSYQIARLYAIPVKGVFVADTGTLFRGERELVGWIVEEFDNKPVANLDQFIDVVSAVPDEKRVSVKYRHVTDMHTPKTLLVQIDRHWHKDIVLGTRNDKTGLWDFKKLAAPLPALPIQRYSAKFSDVFIDGKASNRTELVKSFVKVSSLIPFSIEGYAVTGIVEYGFVVDSEKGYVLVSRNCVPHFLCDVNVTVAESVIVPAKVIFLHPQQNYAIVQYDSSLIDAPIQSIKLSDERLSAGLSVVFLGYNHNFRVYTTEMRVTDITTVSVPVSVDVAPRYRATNLVAPTVDSAMISDCGSGAFADEDGTIRGLWMTYMGDMGPSGRPRQFRLALDTVDIKSTIEQLRANDTIPDPRFLDLELSTIQIIGARIRGVSEDWVTKIQNYPGSRNQFFNVSRVYSTLGDLVETGDILLAIDGIPITEASQTMNISKETVSLTIHRNGEEIEVPVSTTTSSSVVTDKIVSWCGLLVHKPHHAVLQQFKKPPSLVYIADVAFGSPGNLYGLGATQFVTHVNGTSTQTVEEFYEAVKTIPDSTYVKIRVVTFDGIPNAGTIRTNYHYYKTWRRTLSEGKWVLESVKNDESTITA